MRKTPKLVVAAWALAATTALAAPPLIELRGLAMGTTYSVKAWRTAGEAKLDELRAAVEAVLDRFDRQMSTWRPDSELSRFAAAAPNEWFPVSSETAIVTAHALKVFRDTAGASDVTIGPVLRLWHFGPGGARKKGRATPPSDADLHAAQELVGANHLHVRLEPPALKKDVAGLEVDLSSMAPGHAVDLIVSELGKHRYDNCIVELGGEVRAVGTRPDNTAWQVGIESPPGGGDKFAQIVALKNLALASSGDYRDLRTIDGVRYSHVIDPTTGRPLPSRGACVTVLAKTCLEADALGTPLLVMASTTGYQWCVEHDVAALFQERGEKPGDVVRRATPKFVELAGPPQAADQ